VTSAQTSCCSWWWVVGYRAAVLFVPRLCSYEQTRWRLLAALCAPSCQGWTCLSTPCTTICPWGLFSLAVSWPTLRYTACNTANCTPTHTTHINTPTAHRTDHWCIGEEAWQLTRLRVSHQQLTVTTSSIHSSVTPH